MRSVALALVALAVVAGVSGCGPMRGATPSAKEALGSDRDDLTPASLALAAERTAEAIERGQGAETFDLGGRRYPRSEMARSARRVAEIARSSKNAGELTANLARECRAFAVPEPAKVTAYYEPLLAARLRPDTRFRYPIYRLPSAEQLATVLRRLGRKPTRADIDSGEALRGLGLELAWLDDPVARFFLHVQGSGRLVLEDGTETRVGYAGNNGLAYRSVGAVMLERGHLVSGKASASAMRAWLAEHPDLRDALLEENGRYIFFRDTGREGPIGALGATLVAGRSIATDDRYVPRGSLAFLRSTQPVMGGDGRIVGSKPLSRFVFAQDVGAAIQGAARVDVFWGSGEEAGVEAGGMNQAGELALLLCGKVRGVPLFKLPTAK